MKNFSKIMMILFAVVLCVSVMAFSSSAQVEDPAAEIYSDAECTTLVDSYATVEEALAAAEAGQYVIIKKTAENFTTEKKIAEGVFVKAAEGVTFTVSNDIALTLTAVDEDGPSVVADI